MFPELRRIFIGVDPGVTGALAFLDSRRPRSVSVIDMPSAKVKIGKGTRARLSPEQLVKELGWYSLTGESVALIERVNAMPKQGVSSVFTFGHAAGMVHGVLVGQGIPVELVTPQAWAREAGLKRGDTKDAHRHRASQLFPDSAASFTPKGAHNKADAALIAYVLAKRSGAV